MVTDIKINAECTGGTLDKLAELIALRQKFIKGETTKNAVTATAINVTSSLRASTKKAKDKPKDGEHFNVTQISGTVGWRGGKGQRKRVLTQGGHQVMHDIQPIHLLKGHTYGCLFRVEVANEHLEPRASAGNLNPPYYLIYAPDASTAVDRAKMILGRALKKEVGMAKYALGIAMAKISDRPMNAQGPSGSNQMKRAFDAAKVSVDSGDDRFSMEVTDDLEYSALALKGGAGDLNSAMQKAANKTAAIINRFAQYKMDQEIPTPFPEVSR